MTQVKVSIVFAVSWFLLAPLCWGAGTVTIQQGRISVDLKEESLIRVARDIERLAGITFKGDDSLLEETVSVTFNDLPLEQGIKRILAALNYSFLFDGRGEISEVLILPEGSGPSTAQPQVRRAPVRPTAGPQPVQQRPVVRRPGATSPLVPGARTTPTPTRPRTTTAPRSIPQRPAQATPSVPQAPAEPGMPGPFRAIDTLPGAESAPESEGPLHPAFRVIEPPEPASATPKSSQQIPKAPTAPSSDRPVGEPASKEQPAQSGQ